MTLEKGMTMNRFISTGIFLVLFPILLLTTCTRKVTDTCKEPDKTVPSDCILTGGALIQSPTFTIGGTISGLSEPIVLQNNATDDLTVSESGSFVFATAIGDGLSYVVTVKGLTLTDECTITDGSGTVKGGDVSNISISCVPSPPGFHITYDANGGTGGTVPEGDSGLEGAVKTIKANTGNLIRSNYKFYGWNTATDGSGTPYAANASFTVGNADTTLYAQWQIEIGAAPDRPAKQILQTFTQFATLPVAHEHSAAAKIGNKLYLVGGNIGTTPNPATIGLSAGTTDAILEASISSDGTPGNFTKSAFTLAGPRKGASMEIIGNYAYVFGGYTGSGQVTNTPLNTIERATIDANGLTSSFTVIPETLAAGRYNFITLVTAGYVYIIGGGVDAATYHSNTIQRATVDTTTGIISSFSLLTRNPISATEVENGMVDSRETHAGIRLGSNYYIVGGANGGGQLATIEKFVINSDGTLGHFFKQAGTLVRNRVRVCMVALLDKAYVYGGWAGTFISQVESSDITSDVLGAFSDMSGVTLPAPLENGTFLATEKGVFLFGGYNGAISNAIQYAPLQ